ncbi:MAG: ABC transporter permease [Spirochaetes bacterium]|nr:ABC transporter permease [Spirochaetota bacterium]
MKLARIALRNIGRNSRRSILSATATAIATMSMVALVAYVNGLSVDMRRNVADLVTGHVQVRAKDYERYEQLNPLHLRVQRYRDLLACLDAEPEAASAVARLSLPVGIFRGEETVGAQAMGVDMERERDFMRVDRIVASGRLPRAGVNEALVGRALAQKLGAGVGDRITLLSGTMRRSSNALTVEIVGLAAFPVASMDGLRLLLPLDRAIALARMDDSVTEVLVKARDEGRIPALERRVEAVLAEGGWTDLQARTWSDASYMLAFFDMADAAYFVMSLVFFLLASTVLVNTTMMVVFERTREIGTVGALGMKGGEIVRMFLLEALALAVIGALGGVLLGLAIALPLSLLGIDMGSLVQGMSFEISNVVFAKPKPLDTLLIFVYAVAISCVAAYLPARRAARIQPVEALRAI